MMPASIWPMTRGCPHRRASAPSSDDTTSTNATSPITSAIRMSMLASPSVIGLTIGNRWLPGMGSACLSNSL